MCARKGTSSLATCCAARGSPGTRSSCPQGTWAQSPTGPACPLYPGRTSGAAGALGVRPAAVPAQLRRLHAAVVPAAGRGAAAAAALPRGRRGLPGEQRAGGRRGGRRGSRRRGARPAGGALRGAGAALQRVRRGRRPVRHGAEPGAERGDLAGGVRELYRLGEQGAALRGAAGGRRRVQCHSGVHGELLPGRRHGLGLRAAAEELRRGGRPVPRPRQVQEVPQLPQRVRHRGLPHWRRPRGPRRGAEPLGAAHGLLRGRGRARAL
mmetsp:Transcript_13474/g.23909  ORF Transcript_13474/g.23909 Transcript_13474/m.23909 type:complete len:266 (-) Transcript_13474:647-1444(-)